MMGTKRAGRKLLSLIFAFVMVAELILGGWFAPQSAKAASTTQDNPVIFTVIGTVDGVVVKYRIVVEDIYTCGGN